MKTIFDKILGRLREDTGGAGGPTLAKCTDLSIVSTGSGLHLVSWTDPADITLDGGTVAAWSRTVLVRKEGSYPESVGDGTIVAQTSLEDNTHSKYATELCRDMAPDPSKTYYYKLFSETTGGAVNNLADNKLPSATALTPATIHDLSQNGTLLDYLQVGDCIVINHPDFDPSPGGYSGQLVRFMGYDCVTPADGYSHAAVFQFEDCLYNGTAGYKEIAFDPAESQYALTADETAVTGKTYYTKSGSTYTALTEGTDWTAGDSVPPDTWYEKNPNPNYNYGCNKWVDSNLRQYLNADAAGDAWWEAKNIWDAGSYKTRPGFLYNLPFKSLLVPITRTIAISTVYGGGSTTCEDKVFLPTMLEVFNSKINNISEGLKRWDYYTENASDATSRIKLINGTPQHWWLASPNASSGYSVYIVNTSGGSSSSNAYYIRGVAPAFAL